jgi:hypothetical protein
MEESSSDTLSAQDPSCSRRILSWRTMTCRSESRCLEPHMMFRKAASSNLRAFLPTDRLHSSGCRDVSLHVTMHFKVDGACSGFRWLYNLQSTMPANFIVIRQTDTHEGSSSITHVFSSRLGLSTNFLSYLRVEILSVLQVIFPASMSKSKPEHIVLCSGDDLSPICISRVGHRVRSSRPHLCDNLLQDNEIPKSQLTLCIEPSAHSSLHIR